MTPSTGLPSNQPTPDLKLLLRPYWVPVVALEGHVHLFDGHAVHRFHHLEGENVNSKKEKPVSNSRKVKGHLGDEAVPGVLKVMRFVPASVSVPAVRAVVQLRGGARHLGHFGQVGAAHGELGQGLGLGLGLDQDRGLDLGLRGRRHQHVRRPLRSGDGDADRPPLRLWPFKVGRWRSGGRADAGLAEAPGVVLHHHAVGGHDGLHQSALLVHSGCGHRVRSGSISA